MNDKSFVSISELPDSILCIQAGTLDSDKLHRAEMRISIQAAKAIIGILNEYFILEEKESKMKNTNEEILRIETKNKIKRIEELQNDIIYLLKNAGDLEDLHISLEENHDLFDMTKYFDDPDFDDTNDIDFLKKEYTNSKILGAQMLNDLEKELQKLSEEEY